METHGQILSDIKQAILSVDVAADVLQFGSRARGDYEEERDWDVLILTNEEVNDEIRLKYIEVLIPFQIKYAAAINTIIKNKISWRKQVNSDLYSLRWSCFINKAKVDLRKIKCKQALDDTYYLLKDERYLAAVNQMYYAAFYIITAFCC